MGWMISVTPRPRFTPGERAPGTHRIGSWMGSRAGLDTEAIGKIRCLCRGSNPDRPDVQSVVRHHTAWATPALTVAVYLNKVRLCRLNNGVAGSTPFMVCLSVSGVVQHQHVPSTDTLFHATSPIEWRRSDSKWILRCEKEEEDNNYDGDDDDDS
jgi:hypothetical protein